MLVLYGVSLSLAKNLTAHPEPGSYDKNGENDEHAATSRVFSGPDKRGW
jgi:hypothetical protein